MDRSVFVLKGLLGLSTALVLASCSQPPADAARQYIAQGDRFAAEGRHNAAVIEYRNASRNAPASPEVHEKLADSLVQLGRIEEAYREYTIASRIVDGQPLPQTEDELRAAVAAHPSAASHIALADLLLTRGQLLEAEQQLLAATAREPQNELANRALAALYVSNGNREAAEKHLRIAAQQQPQRYRSGLALADFLMEAGRHAEARRLLEPAREDARLRDAVAVRLAAIDYEDGLREQAQRALDELLEARPSAEAWTLKAEWQFRERKLAEARASAAEALNLNPDLAAARTLTEQIRRDQLYPASTPKN